jgi:putative spermidine/putrescine transport system substrate-binding protein
VLKGTSVRKDAFELIASTQDPSRQIEFLRLVGNGPVNPAANEIMPAELADLNPSNPKNLAVMVKADNEWYAKQSAPTLKRFFDEVLT